MIPFDKIIDALNSITGKKFLYVETHRIFIRARWKEGFRFDDFVYVIRVKNEQWRGTDDAIYLRPSTLFGTKMDGYRQQPYRKPQSERQPEPPEPEQTAEEKIEAGYSSRYLGILNERRSYNWDAEEYERLKMEWSREETP